MFSPETYLDNYPKVFDEPDWLFSLFLASLDKVLDSSLLSRSKTLKRNALSLWLSPDSTSSSMLKDMTFLGEMPREFLRSKLWLI